MAEKAKNTKKGNAPSSKKTESKKAPSKKPGAISKPGADIQPR